MKKKKSQKGVTPSFVYTQASSSFGRVKNKEKEKENDMEEEKEKKNEKEQKKKEKKRKKKRRKKKKKKLERPNPDFLVHSSLFPAQTFRPSSQEL